MKKVSYDKWRDGIKFLRGYDVNPTLTASDQRKLQLCLRGPFANGMKEHEAILTLQKVMKWVKP